MKKRSERRIWLVGFGAVLLGVVSCIPFMVASLFVVPMMENLQTTAASITMYISVSAIGGTVGSFAIGWLMKKINIKIIVAVSGVFSGLLLVTIGFSTNLTLIYIAAFFQGIGSVLGGMTLSNILISKWFIKAKGTMMSLVMVFVTMVGAVATPVIASCIETVGYQTVATVLGLVTGISIILIGIIAIVDDPESIGLKPYGYETVQQESQGHSDSKVSVDISFKAAILTAPFWCIMAVKVFTTVASQGSSSNASPFFQSLGLDSVQAGLVIAVQAIAGLIFSVVTGILIDKKSTTLAGVVNIVTMSAAFLLTFLWSGRGGAILCGVMMAAATSINIYVPNIIVELFGTKSSGQLIGISGVAGNIGSFIGPILVSSLFDKTGSFILGYEIIGIMCVISMLLIVCVGKAGVGKN